MKRRLSEDIKMMFIRMWAAGAVWYFVGFGLEVGKNSPIDLIFFIVLALVLVEWIILFPINRLAFNTSDKNIDKEDSYWKNMLRVLLNTIKIIFIVLVIVYIYWLINQIITIVPSMRTFGVEPILFGLLYGGIYYLISLVKQKIYILIRKIKGQK